MCIPEADQTLLHVRVCLVMALFLFSSCGIANRSAPGIANDGNTNQGSSVLVLLNQAHQEWKGTPYVLGGSGINGVDCSSFMQRLFKEYFGMDLPRNTRQQLQEGISVRRQHIRPGDLIFFRTGRDLLHVGVAMDEGRFLHASVSTGVKISRLNQRYWASRYLATRRLL